MLHETDLSSGSQASEAGRKLRALLRPSDTIHFFTSPYRRTRETTEGILASLTSDDPTPSPFPRQTIKVYEEPRLREQDFGNFQPCSAEMARMWQERADYGHFFYRIPDGESAADAYDRISGFNESLWRSFGEDDFASVCVLVTHGLMTRVFLMKWYHWSVEYFEDLRNINHCEFIVMRQSAGKYVLQNHLRTWTEYREEKRAEKEAEDRALGREVKPADPPAPVRKKRWGGCPDGCNHGTEDVKRPPRRQNTADLFQDDTAHETVPNETLTEQRSSTSPQGDHANEKRETKFDEERPSDARGRTGYSDGDTEEEQIEPTSKMKYTTGGELSHSKQPPLKNRILSPNRLEFLRGGRDGGGSRSGHGSEVGSDEESIGNPPQRRRMSSMASALNGDFDSDGGFRSGAMADALGDQSDIDEVEEEVREQEAKEDTFEESVR